MSKNIMEELESLDSKGLEALIKQAREVAREKRKEEKNKKLAINDEDIARLNDAVRDIVKKRKLPTELVIEALIRKTRTGKRFQYIPAEEKIYQNPQDFEQTWNGHGRMPKWLRTRVEAGEDIKAFIINNDS